jgi:hypothetical protein
VPGAWNAICDRCGFQHKNYQLKKEWTGLMVCGKCFETRHPQDLLRVPTENPSVPWTRPDSSTDTFVASSSPLTTEDGSSTQFWILDEVGINMNTETQSA